MNQARYHLAGEPISKNAFRRFESVYKPEMPEMHLQNFEKIQSQKSGEISRNLRFSRFFVPASKSDTHHGRDGWDRTNEMQESKSCALPLGYIPIKKAKQPVFDARSFAYPQAAVRAVFPRYYISIFISCQVKRKPAEAFCFEKKFNAAPSHGA